MVSCSISVYGTNAKCRPGPETSAVWGRPDIPRTSRKRHLTRNGHGGTQHQPDLGLRRGLSAERQPAIEQQAVPFDDIRSERFGVLLIVGLHCRGLTFERPVVETVVHHRRLRAV